MIERRERVPSGLLTAVGLLDVLLGFWFLASDATVLWWLGAGLMGLGAFLLATAHRDKIQAFPRLSASLTRLGLGRLSLVALLGICLLARLLFRAAGR